MAPAVTMRHATWCLAASVFVALALFESATAIDYCTVNHNSWPVCSSTQSGWAFENYAYCVGRNHCPGNSPVLGSPRRSGPADTKANAKTRAILAYLQAIEGKATLAGQADLSWDDSVDMAERVKSDTGKYPALMGYDFMDYGLSDRSGQHQVEEAIAYAGRGGLVTFHWHWRDPATYVNGFADELGQFYANEADASKNTAFTIPMANGGLDTSSQAFQQINGGIDMVAAQLKRLQDAGVSVLWRPLHEASGWEGQGWFWWGRKRSDGVPQALAHIQLWRHMFNRLTNVHGLHNLLWVWNGQDLAWYPGDDVVDIVGHDDYSDNKNYDSHVDIYRSTELMSGGNKPAALTETSYIPDPDKTAADGVFWLYFMVWNDGSGPAGPSDSNNFWSGEYYNTNAHKRKVYSHANVITLDELPKFTGSDSQFNILKQASKLQKKFLAKLGNLIGY